MAKTKVQPQLAPAPAPLSYEGILNRDVPAIREHARLLARQGIVGNIAIYYKHRAIAGSCDALTVDLTNDGWTPTGISIPCNIGYDRYWNYLYNRLMQVPLFA